MAKSDLSAQRLRDLLSYNQETGVFHWRNDAGRFGRIKAGSPAGSVNSVTGYQEIGIAGRKYYAHILAWLHVTGRFPDGEIDHIDMRRENNSFANLRDVPKRINIQNKRRPNVNNLSGYLGVHHHKKNNKWCAAISSGAVRKYLGSFDSPEAAHLAYLQAKRQMHAGCTI